MIAGKVHLKIAQWKRETIREPYSENKLVSLDEGGSVTSPL